MFVVLWMVFCCLIILEVWGGLVWVWVWVGLFGSFVCLWCGRFVFYVGLFFVSWCVGWIYWLCFCLGVLSGWGLFVAHVSFGFLLFVVFCLLVF